MPLTQDFYKQQMMPALGVMASTAGKGLAGIFQKKDPLQEAILAMKTQGGSLSSVRKFIANLQKAGTPEERQRVFSQEYPALLSGEQGVANLMLQNMLRQMPGGMGYPPQSTIGQFLGENRPIQAAIQEQISGVGQQTRPGELPLASMPFGKPPMMGGGTPTAFGTRPGQREYETEQRFKRVQQQFPGQPRLSEAWKSLLPVGTEEVLGTKERALTSAKETGELDNVIAEFKRWHKEGYMINQAEQAAEVARKTLGPYGVDLIQVLLDEYVDPEWMKELDSLDPSQRQLLGLYKDERGRTKWRPSEDEATRIKQGALLQIARTPTPTWKDIRNWNSSAQLDVFVITFGIPGIEGEKMAQKLFQAGKISLQEMPYIAKPMIKRNLGSQEYIDGIVALQVMFMPEQIKFIEWLAKNPDQREAYVKLVDNILKATGKETIKEFLENTGIIAKPGLGEKLIGWLYKEKE